MVDRYLKIKTKLDNSEVDADVSELEDKLKGMKIDNQLEDLEKQLDLAGKEVEIKLTAKNEAEQELTNTAQKVTELTNLYEELKQKKQQYDSIVSRLQEGEHLTESGTQVYKNLEQQVSQMESIRQEALNLINYYEKMQKQVQKTNTEYDKSLNKVTKLKNKIDEIDLKKNINESKQLSENIEETTGSSNKFGKTLDSSLRKIGRMVLGIFSIRSAYGALQRASSTLAQYDKKYASNLEYIRYILAQTLAPVLQWVLGLVEKLLGYINYLAKAWFNVSLFSKSSAKNFMDAQKSTSKMKKDLQSTGFDEQTVLQDTSDTGASGGIAMPTLDFENVEIPEWLVKFKEFCQPVIDFFNKIIEKYGPVKGGIIAIVGALAGLFILKGIISLIKNLGKATVGISADFTGFLNSLGKATEIIAVLGGLALVITSITGLIDTFSQSGMTLGETAGLLGIVLGELVVTFILLAGAMQLLTSSWQSIAGAIVIFGGLALVLVTVTNLIDTFSKSGITLNDVIGLMATILISVVALMGAVALLGPAMTAGLVPFVVVITGISVLLAVVAATLPTILDACSKFMNDTAPVIIALIITMNECLNNTIRILGEVLPPIIKSIGSLFNSIFNGISNVVTSVGNTVSKIVTSMGNAVVSIFEAIRRIIQQVGDTITQVATSIIWFINALGPAINNFVDNTIVAITKLVNFVVSAVEYLVNTALGGLNGVISTINKVPGVNFPRINSVYIPRFRPRLATGGIVNMPGRGVDIGGAIAGEAGKEGVLPLTNPQAMSELGREIGKWINVNNVLNNYMDGRLIQRSMNKRNQELAFATNGR